MKAKTVGKKKLPAKAKANEFAYVPGVLGVGKGVEKGLPLYEFKSVWQYIIPSKDSKKPDPWTQDPVVPPQDLKLTILSVVSSVGFGRNLDLQDIANKGFDLHYDPDSFTPMVMRMKNPSATGLIFQSGKMVVTGTKSEAENRLAAQTFADRIEKMGYRVSVAGLQIQNITATCRLGFRVRVHLLAKDKHMSTGVGYHPELFTGVTVSLAYPRSKAIIFRTGSVLITGVKSAEEAHAVLRSIYPLAKLYSN